MRRVDSEGDSRDGRGREERGGARPGPSSTSSHLRRLALESLERRELLATGITPTTTSTLPSPVVQGAAGHLVGSGSTAAPNASSPSVAVDPSDPRKLVSAWVVHDPAHGQGVNNAVVTYVAGAYSLDGGQTWSPLRGASSANIQADFAVAPPQNAPQPDFAETTGATVAFGRDESAYLLTMTDNGAVATDGAAGTAGVIDLQRFSFRDASPINPPTQTLTNKQVYAWSGSDPATTPTLNVDDNLPSFTDINAQGRSTTQVDPFAGNVYVAWASTDAPYFRAPANFQAQTIKMVSSSDQGQDFTHVSFVDDTSNRNHVGAAHYAEPSIAISQGRPAGTLGPADLGVPGGQVTIVYDDYGTGAKAPIPFDRIVNQTDLVGGTDENFSEQGRTPLTLATKNPVSGAPDILGTTSIPILVNINDANFTALQNLDVTLQIAYPDAPDLQVILVPPTGSGLGPVTLFNNGVNGAGTAVNVGSSLTGSNLGIAASNASGNGSGPGTVFDATAVRSITDSGNPTQPAPYTGHFRPIDSGEVGLLNFQGLAAARLDGTWTIQILDYKAETTFPLGSSVAKASLDFSSGNNPGGGKGERVVADGMTLMAAITPSVNSTNPAAANPISFRQHTTGVSADPGRSTTSSVQALPVLPTPVVASDNTLGAFSQHQGWIYVAYTGRYDGSGAALPRDQTDIFLIASADGGATWNAIGKQAQATDPNEFNPFVLSGGVGVQVNDDNTATDGFSEGNPGEASLGLPGGRPQLQPQVAVDQYTGGVVVSFLDARNDAARSRVATYVAVSNNGGQTFAPETYANPTNTAVDAITGRTVNLGPVPDNQSNGNENKDALGFGQHQGLAVADGRIIPVWSSNENLGFAKNAVGLSIRSSIMTDAGGPRVIGATMGPVGEPGDTVNTLRAADGSPVANSFDITFDRPIDPATFQPDGPAGSGQPIGTGDVRVYFQDPYGPTVLALAPIQTPAGGSYTSTLSTSGHPGEPIVDGRLTILLTRPMAVGSVTIQLVAPDGRSFNVVTGSSSRSISGTYALPANVVGGVLDGSYQLKVVDSSGQVGNLSWMLQLNGVSTGLRVLTIAPIPDLSDPQDNGNLGYTRFRVTFDPTDPTDNVKTGVGTYSYVIRPNLSDRIRSVLPSTPVVENAQLPTLPTPGLPLAGTTLASSTLYLVGHPGKTILSGSVAISLTDTNVNDLTITLFSPAGTPFVLPKSTGTALNQSFSLPAGFQGQAVDGKYTLQVADASGADVGVLNSWGLNIQGAGLGGNSMDQNADGTPGEDPETAKSGTTLSDDFAAPSPVSTTATTYNGSAFPTGPYVKNSLPLIVSGPHIVTTTVSGTGGATTGTTVDGLIANDQVNTVGVTFDRNVEIGSVTGSQILSILGPAGPIAGPQAFNSGGVARTFTPNNVNVGLAIPKSTDSPNSLVSPLVISGTGLNVSSLKVTVNVTDPVDSSLTLTLIAPDGTQVPLAAGVGGAGANFSNTTFSDAATANGTSIPIARGVAPFGLTYVPSSPLSALAGKRLDGTWMLKVTDSTAAGARGRLNSWSLSVTPQIPQGAGTSLTSSLSIANPDKSFTIGHLVVQLNLSAPLDRAISAVLVAPDGSRVFLFGGVGGTGANFSGTTLDDSAAIPIGNGVAPFTQAYKPGTPTTGGYTTLTGLINKPIDGTWKLILDDSSNGPAATLNSWSLIATPQVKIAPAQVYASTDTGTQTYVSTDTGTQAYPSYDTPQAIGSALNATVVSRIAIPSTGRTFNLANLEVQLNILYEQDTNLSVTLTAPNGVSVPLFAGVGGNGANFTDTILADSGTVPIAFGASPFNSALTGVIYRPASPLSVLYGNPANPLPVEGTWTLTITNDRANGPSGGLDQLQGWALIATPRPAPAAMSLPAGATQPAEPISQAGQTLTSTISFPSTAGTFRLADLTANLTLVDPSGSDDLSNLSAVLVAPNGARVTLFAAGTLSGSSFSGPFRPLNTLQLNPARSPFANLPVDGDWRLEVTDNGLNRTGAADMGALLKGWSLTVTPTAIAQEQPAEPVPFTPASSLTSTIQVADGVPLNGLRLRLNVTSPRDSDLSAVLVGPNGQSIRLFTGLNVSGVDFANTVFDDNAATSIDAAKAPYGGAFRPEDPLSRFAAAGISTLGQWKLVITEVNPGNDPTRQAVLQGWSLINTPPPTATLANSYRISFPTQQLSGVYALTVGAGILGADPSVNNPMALPNPALGTPANPNLNAGVDVLKGTSASGVVATAAATYNATNIPPRIPAATVGGGTTTPGTLISQLNVPDNFLVQGVTAAGLPGLTVQLNITYANDADLAAVLIAPDGTSIPLFTHVGVGSANFNNTILDDTVNPPAPIDSAGAGFFGRFNPETPLGDLANKTSGGAWTLQITNRNAGMTGTLNSWSLTFQRPLPSSGLGDPVADRQSVSFRIFNMAATNPLADSTWTAVGPAGVTVTPGQKGTFAGSVAAIAYDPSDPTRNTVYVGASSGGIWKTTDFSTTKPGGPTYLPLTDFGPDFGLDIGGIAVFGRNSDPSRSILFAGTGFAQATYPYNGGGPSFANYGGPVGRGVGFLRSFDGGQTWTLLDSLVNVDGNGNPLPENSPLRDHHFVGDTTYKVVVDPTPLPNGNVIVYAALGGPTGGLYRSLDTGATWTDLSPGITAPRGGVSPNPPAAATDVILDPNSRSPSTGNIDIVYAAFAGVGVFLSSNRGQGLALMAGQLGNDPLIQGFEHFPPVSATVGNPATTPNGANGRIVLAKPALTGNAAEDLLYQDWLYAAVEGANGRFLGLYVTKDRGQNWTDAKLLNIPNTSSSLTLATPTNDTVRSTPYDVTANQTTTDFFQNGNYDLTLTIDPTNPNIVYLGGTQDFQQTGLVRVDLTGLYDAHNFVSFDNSRDDGGKLTVETAGAFNVGDPTGNNLGALYPSTTFFGPTPYLNLRHAPNTPGVPGTSPFNLNATLVIRGAATDYVGNAIAYNRSAVDFTNDGSGVKWTLFDEPLKANAGDATGSTNLHASVAFVDPVTGNVRLIFADDQGVFTALVNPDGTLDDGVGANASANYSRNGNLQDEQFYYGAAQPSNVASQAAGALFYASGQGLLAAQSDPNVLNSGDITWDDGAVLSPTAGSTRDSAGNLVLGTSDRGGVGIATDPTGGVTGPGPSVYEYDVPSLGGNLTDFFRVADGGSLANAVGQTTGLDGNYRVEFPFGNYRFDATSGQEAAAGATLASNLNNGLIPEGNFAVNPLNGSQLLISSTRGTLYQTTNKGVQWLPIGSAADFGVPAGSPIPVAAAHASAVAYGAPDPNAPGGIGNLNNFIYVGTVGNFPNRPGTTTYDPGRIFVTTIGGGSQSGGGWQDISTGLDGSSVVAIYPSPDRGSRAAYAVTLDGVFFNPNTVPNPTTNPKPTWVNITGNLAQIQHAVFGDATLGEARFSGFEPGGITPADPYQTGQYGGFRSLVADYRYQVPDPSDPTKTYPVLYVSGFGGVFRSLDNGQTWTDFPDTSFDSAPVDGGYLPSVSVTNLQLNLGAINPATGHPNAVANDPEVLMATTFGRGVFAIRLAPYVFPATVHLDATLPAPTGSDTGAQAPFFNPDITGVATPYIDGVGEISDFGNTTTITLIDRSDGPGRGHVLGTGTTDATGRFSIRLVNDGTDPTFFRDSPAGVIDDKVVGIQATESSGAKGNITTFAYTLKAAPAAAPKPPVLEAASDTGRSSSDDITNLSVPMAFPGRPLNITAPVFDVTLPVPGTAVIELLRASSPNGPFIPVAAVLSGGGPGTIADAGLAVLAAADLRAGTPLNATFYYEAIQVNQAGLVSGPSGLLRVVVDTVTPPTLPAATLDPASNSGLVKPRLITNVVNPVFDVAGVPPDGLLFLYRTLGNATPIVVGAAPAGSNRVTDQAGARPDGTYVYSVVQVDVAGNVSNFSVGLPVTIDTQVPAAPTINLVAADDSGLPFHPYVTNVASPRFSGTAPTGLPLDILAVSNTNPSTFASGIVLASTTPAVDGSYLVKINKALADGQYILVARTTNQAGTFNYSAPLIVTIKATPPQVVPMLSIFPADDTGIKGDGVTANHRPRFSGRTDPGDTVTLYVLTNGQLSPPEATTTASTVDGSFTFQLPFNLTDGATRLVAQSSDIANNRGPLGAPFGLRIVTVAGDYYDTGAAQFTVFRPLDSGTAQVPHRDSETYLVRGAGQAPADFTPGRDIPVQVDFSGDGRVDLVAYRFNTAEFVGYESTTGLLDYQFGFPNLSLPVPGYYGGTGTLVNAEYFPLVGHWVVALPTGAIDVLFGVPEVDIPTPAAFDGNGATEVAVFRPTYVVGGDADSFSVAGPNGIYVVSFTNPAVQKLGFTFKPGDVPAPADYAGLGRDQFAVYRPTTGQFFILTTPNVFVPATWTMKTVSLNLPGGPNVNDVPASEDYEGTGKVDPTVYRPSNSTFYQVLNSGVQQPVPFGLPGDVAAAGPILYRLSALKGPFASNDGYPALYGAPPGPSNRSAISPAVRADSIVASASSGASPTALVAATTIALATPTASVAAPAPAAPASVAKVPVVVGTTTPKVNVATPIPASPEMTAVGPRRASAALAKPKAQAKAAQVRPLTVEIAVHRSKVVPTAEQHRAAVEAALRHLGSIQVKKGPRRA